MYWKEFLGLLPFSCKLLLMRYKLRNILRTLLKRSNLHFSHINHTLLTFTKLGQNLQRKQRYRFWLQSRVNTTIFQVMQIIWTCGSFCVDALLVMSSETLDFRRRAQSALSQESPSKATRVSSFEFMGKTECKLINRHIESALT